MKKEDIIENVFLYGFIIGALFIAAFAIRYTIDIRTDFIPVQLMLGSFLIGSIAITIGMMAHVIMG